MPVRYVDLVGMFFFAREIRTVEGMRDLCPNIIFAFGAGVTLIAFAILSVLFINKKIITNMFCRFLCFT